jgi:ADP-heptose:LPS heptosyltransferase
LAREYPGAQIHVLTKAPYAELWQNNPYVHHIHTFSGNWSALFAELNPYVFDWYLDLHRNLRTLWLKARLRHRVYFTYPKYNLRKWLLVNFKWNTMGEYSVPLAYFAQLPIPYDGAGPDAHFAHWRGQVPGPNGNYTVLVLGAKFRTKQAPAPRLLQVIHGLQGAVVLLGGREEVPLAAWLMEHSDNKPLDYTGKLGLGESAWLIRGASAVVAHDTGYMHVAAAFDKPMAVLWGNTVPSFGFKPLYPNDSVAPVLHLSVEGLSCRPCSKLGHDTCPRRHFNCMERHDYDALCTWVNLLLP